MKQLGQDEDLRAVAAELTRQSSPQPFSRADLLALHDTLSERARGLMAKKNADYGTTSPFQNLRFAEGFGISAEQAVLVRLGDKLSRINTLLERPAAVTDESFEDTLIDVINYTVLLAGLRKEKENK